MARREGQWIDIYARLMPRDAREGRIVSVGDGAGSRPLHGVGRERAVPAARAPQGSRHARATGGLEATQWLDRPGWKHCSSRSCGVPRRHRRSRPVLPRVFAADGIEPATCSRSAISRIPFLTKPLIRANVDRLKADGAGKLMRYSTGGSSGEPLVFYMGSDRVSHDVAAKWRATRWWGVDIGDPEIVVWGSPIELGARTGSGRCATACFAAACCPPSTCPKANLDRFLADQGAAAEDAVRLSVRARPHRPARRAPR